MKFLKFCSRFLSLSFPEKLVLGEAVFYLFSAKLILLVLPFRICAKTIAQNNYNKDQPSSDILQSIKYAIERANRLSCWKNVCLVQSFAGRWMLQRRRINSDLIIGIKKDDQKKMLAHAWLMVGSKEIVSGANGYLPIMKY